VNATGVIIACGQKVALGRPHAGQTITVHASQDTLAVELDDQEIRTITRPTSRPASPPVARQQPPQRVKTAFGR
jgi:hypothetical protein